MNTTLSQMPLSMDRGGANLSYQGQTPLRGTATHQSLENERSWPGSKDPVSWGGSVLQTVLGVALGISRGIGGQVGVVPLRALSLSGWVGP